MSSTLLEVTRSAHEEVERLERLIVKDLQNEPTSNKDRLFQSHRVRNMIDNIISTTDKLVEIYEDKDNARKDEIAALGGQTAAGTNVFSAFYDRLKEIREYHRRHPAARVVDANEEFEGLLKEEPQIEFSGEEAMGRYLDLHELFNQFINSKFGDPSTEYSTYLDVFSQPHKIPHKLKLTRQYKEYMENLLEYLIYFFQRTEPFKDLDRIFSEIETEFEDQWANNAIEGWENMGQENGHVPAQHTVIDLHYYSTVEELVEVGPEKLIIEACYRYNLELHEKEEIAEEIARLRSAVSALTESKKSAKGAPAQLLDAFSKLEVNNNRNLERAMKEITS